MEQLDGVDRDVPPEPGMNITPGATIYAIDVPRDAVCRLGQAGHPLSPTALLVYLALLGLPAEFGGDISYNWLGVRVGQAERPAGQRRLLRLLKDLEHAGLVEIDHLHGRAPRLIRALPSEPTVQVPFQLLWPDSARACGPARDGAREAIVALLCVLAVCDPHSRSGSAALPALTAYRQQHRLAPNSDVQEVGNSRARLEALAADTMVWTRPATPGEPGRGAYRVAYDFSSFGVQPRPTLTPAVATDQPPGPSSILRIVEALHREVTHAPDGDLRRVLLRAHATLAAGGPSSIDDTLAVLAGATGWDRDQARAAFEVMRTFGIADVVGS